jgi:hypothetical protein
MESLPPWALWVTAVAGGFSPPLAFFMVGAIGRSLSRTLWPRPNREHQFGPEQVRNNVALVISPM